MKIFLSILFLLLNLGIKEDCEKLLINIFGNNVKTEFLKYNIAPELKNKIEQECRQRFIRNYVYIWKIYDNNKHIATAFLDDVYGKSLPITFLVIFDLNGKILDTEIIKYRESYGNAVQEKNWLNQFKGKDASSKFKTGDDISSISGATISANSVSTGIKKLSKLYSYIKDEL